MEDDREIAELIATYLRKDGAGLGLAASAEEAERICLERAPDLVLLDLGLPGADGLEFLRWLRLRSLAPVMIVSARESDEDKVQGLGLGADDFISKPFSPRVLAARAAALVRRVAYDAGDPSTLPGVRRSFGPYTIDFEARLVSRGGERVVLTRREYELLSFLVLHEGKTYGPAELYAEVWGLEHGDLSTVAVHIQRVRRKIEENPSAPRWLQTISGAGYRFAGPGTP